MAIARPPPDLLLIALICVTFIHSSYADGSSLSGEGFSLTLEPLLEAGRTFSEGVRVIESEPDFEEWRSHTASAPHAHLSRRLKKASNLPRKTGLSSKHTGKLFMITLLPFMIQLPLNHGLQSLSLKKMVTLVPISLGLLLPFVRIPRQSIIDRSTSMLYSALAVFCLIKTCQGPSHMLGHASLLLASGAGFVLFQQPRKANLSDARSSYRSLLQRFWNAFYIQGAFLLAAAFRLVCPTEQSMFLNAYTAFTFSSAVAFDLEMMESRIGYTGKYDAVSILPFLLDAFYILAHTMGFVSGISLVVPLCLVLAKFAMQLGSLIGCF